MKGEFRVAELYDVKNDPTETVNLAVDVTYNKTMKNLSVQLEKGWKAAMP